MRSAISRYGDRIGDRIGGGAPIIDPYWASVVLYAPFQAHHALTANGGAATDTAQKPFGVSSLLLDGTNDNVTAPDSADWNFGSGDFTVEAAIRLPALPSSGNFMGVVSQWGTGVGQAWACSVWNDTGTYKSRLAWNTGSGAAVADLVITPSVDTWHYLGWARSGTSVLHSFDGSVTTSASAISGTLQNSAEDLEIGSVASGAYLAGWIGYVRITKGVAREMNAIPTALFPMVGS
jgi:hypothetical protein